MENINQNININIDDTKTDVIIIDDVEYVIDIQEEPKCEIILDSHNPEGQKGDTGNGISSAVLNDDYTLTLYFTDGTSYTTPSIRGATGDSGVYVGTTEPTDPDVNVWLNPDGTQGKTSQLINDGEGTEPFITDSDVGNGTLTIQVNGTNVQTFSANQSTNATANILVPDSATWGNITGTLSNQTDLNNELTSIQGDIDDIEYLIPSQATTSNQLADKSFVNSSISTNTANFIGTFNSVADLEAYSGTVTNNDYAFVVGTDNYGNTIYNRYKYTTATTPASWIFEYALNNSSFTSNQWASINSGVTANDVSLAQSALQPNDNISDLTNDAGYITSSDLSSCVPYSNATGAVDLNGQDLKNVDNLAVGTSTVDSNEKILSVGQNRFVSNNNNGLFISSTTSQTRKGMYGVPMALEIQFNSNNQAYSYPLGFHDMNSNGQGGQFLFTSFSSAISAATAGDVMVENDKGGLIFNTGASKTGSKMRFVVGTWSATPQLTLTANSVGIKNNNPNSNYALDVSGTINASTDIKINGSSVALKATYDAQNERLILG